ncbi:MAG TPA: ECF-type sigma factor [Bryobacteraceae bacterium]
MSPSNHKVSALLGKLALGDRSVENELFLLVYDELRRIARTRLKLERPGHTLQASALVHEVYIRLAGATNDVKSRAHFFALASRVMRRVLIDQARGKQALRRGGLAQRIALEDAIAFHEEHPELALDLDAAIKRLGALDARQAEVVELRFYSGLTEEEVALILGVNSRTIKREWRSAKLWLEAELSSSTKSKSQDEIS